jgi:N-acetylglucosamine kinase-like BadF-type ATPase
VEAVSATEEFVKMDVVSDVVLLVLLDETGSGVVICPGTGAVAPRMGTLRNDEG